MFDDIYQTIRQLQIDREAVAPQWMEQGDGAEGYYSDPSETLRIGSELGDFQSKYNNARDLGDGRVLVTLQQPGKHKYDTLDAIYRMDPETGQYVMEGEPQPTRQVSSAQRIKDSLEHGVGFVGTGLAAGYGLGAAMGAYGGAAAGGAGAASGGAAGAGTGGIGTLGTIAAGSAPVAPLAASGLATAPTLASLPQIGAAVGAAGAAAGAGSGAGAAGAAGAAAPSSGGSLLTTAGNIGSGLLDAAGGYAPLLGTVANGLIQKDAIDDATQAQVDAANASNALLREQWEATTARNQPFVEGGTTAFNALMSRLGLSGDPNAAGYGSFGKIPTQQDVMAEPGYQFGMTEGMNALNSAMNARGVSGGAALKAATRYANDYASGQYNNAFNRYQSANQQAYNQLGNVANMGQSSANQTAQAGANFAGQSGQNLMGASNASAANSLAQGNIWSDAINQGISAYRNLPTQNQQNNSGGFRWDDPYRNPNYFGGDQGE